MRENYNKRFADLLRVFGEDFDRHVTEDPDFSARIPPKAHIIIQLEVPENIDLRLRREVELFNQWAMDLALKQSEPEEEMIVVVSRFDRKDRLPVVIEKDDEVFIAYCPGVGGVYEEAATKEEAIQNAYEAACAILEARGENGRVNYYETGGNS